MKILVTGSRGFLGSALVRHWKGRHELTLIRGRAGFAQAIAKAPDCDWVIHCGFEVSFRPNPASVERNMESGGAIARFVSAGKAKNLLFVSAAGVMGVSSGAQVRNEDFFGKTDPGFESYRNTAYIESKIRGEELFRSAKIPLTVVYPTTIFGAGMPPETLRSLLESRIAPPGGTSFLALGDFLRAVDILIQEPAEGERYILNGANLPFRDLFTYGRSVTKNPGKFYVLPEIARPALRAAGLVFRKSFLAPAVLDSAFGFKYYSAEKFRRRFSWEPDASPVASLRSALEQD